MTESTSEYKKRIEEIKQSIENEPYMAKMREDIAEGISKTGIRQAAVEEQFQDLLDETTGKDVISAPELIAARNGKSNLKTRLDDEHAQVTAQLAQKLTQEEVQSLIAGIAEGTPLFASDTAEMTDTARLYVNTTDGLIYVHNGTTWVDTGVLYQSIGLADNSVSLEKIDFSNDVALVGKNLVTNGDFSEGKNGWQSIYGTISAEQNNLLYTITSVGASNNIRQPINFNTSHKYYVKMEINPKYSNSTSVWIGDKVHTDSVKPEPNTWNTLSWIIQPKNLGDIRFYHVSRELNQTTYIVGDQIKFRSIMVIDLTEAFGFGNEPTVNEMDDIMTRFPNRWFDGIKSLITFKELNYQVENLKKESSELSKVTNYQDVFEDSDVYVLDVSKGDNFIMETGDRNKELLIMNPDERPNNLLSITLTIKYTNSIFITFPTNVLWQNNNHPSFSIGKSFMVLFQSFDKGKTWLGAVVGEWEIPESPKAIMVDTFTRPDNSTSAGVADTGQVWETTSSTVVGISNNKLYPVSGTTPTVQCTLLSDFSASFDFTVGAITEESGLQFRSYGYSSADRVMLACTRKGILLNRFTNGTKTTLGEYLFDWEIGETHKIKVVAHGAIFKVFVDGIKRIELYDTNNVRDYTRVGILFFGYNSNITRVDNFMIEEVL